MQRLPKDEISMNNTTHHNNDYLQIAYKVVESIGEILEDIIQENWEEQCDEEMLPQLIRAFSSKRHPTIPIHDYLKRIEKYTKAEPSTIIITLIYIDKIVEITNMQWAANNIHRVIWSCLVVALKYNEDDYYSNAYYAKVGGVSLNELNNLEYSIIKILKFNMFVDEIVYNRYKENWDLDGN